VLCVTTVSNFAVVRGVFATVVTGSHDRYVLEDPSCWNGSPRALTTGNLRNRTFPDDDNGRLVDVLALTILVYPASSM